MTLTSLYSLYYSLYYSLPFQEIADDICDTFERMLGPTWRHVDYVSDAIWARILIAACKNLACRVSINYPIEVGITPDHRNLAPKGVNTVSDAEQVRSACFSVVSLIQVHFLVE